MTEIKKVTLEEIQAGKSEKGGWNKKTLAQWGVPWPPPKGWQESLIKGEPLAERTVSSNALWSRFTGDEGGKFLHKVVMAVIETGNGEILKDIEGLSEYYGNSLPTVADVIGDKPKNAIIEGGITFDDKVYKFSCIRSSVRDAQ